MTGHLEGRMSIVTTSLRQYVGVHARGIFADELTPTCVYFQVCHSTSPQDGIKRIPTVPKMQPDRRPRKNPHEETCPNIRPKATSVLERLFWLCDWFNLSPSWVRVIHCLNDSRHSIWAADAIRDRLSLLETGQYRRGFRKTFFPRQLL